MNNISLSGGQLNTLLAMASKKLGKSPGEILAQAQSGNIDGLTAGLDPKTKANINGILQNPKALDAIIKKFSSNSK